MLDLKLVAKKYLLSWFIIDVVSAIPLNLILGDSTHASVNQVGRLVKLPRIFRVMRLLRLMKLARVVAITKVIEWVESSYNIHQVRSKAPFPRAPCSWSSYFLYL